ncbi:MAG: hypothetical protein LBE92_19615 [Chryseobacterium sp.]|jgi:hypothetical protein|uniref:hypothetical protein n=1 Tax=Chryseobacterium sp. TaxID=1871047 RepID=UPI002834183F|nr:hypothetical protein [Chryseobacterium sp.]MDR2238339.1 hypothetical protein [Chryseobacterium sp.]
MSGRIKINQTVSVFSASDESSKTATFLYRNNIVEFNREKRRNGINWMEIYLQGKKSYIKKDFSKMYILKKAKLIDDACTVVFFESKTAEDYDFHDVFTPHQLEDMNQESVQMKRIYDQAQKEVYVNLYYNKSTVDVSKRIFASGEEIVITSEKGMFLEVLYGKKLGYILSDVTYYETRNWWIIIVAAVVVLGITGGSFYALIDTGRTITGPILAVPALIITAVIVVFIKFFLALFNMIFHNIRKRF